MRVPFLRPNTSYAAKRKLITSPHTGNVVKNLAFGVGILIMAVGAAAILVPAGLAWIAQHSVTPGAFHVIAAVRVTLGLALISVASVSRAPRTLRILGYLILVAGVATALTGLAGIERARVMIEWWLKQGSGVIRLTGALVLALGGFITFACAPIRRAA